MVKCIIWTVVFSTLAVILQSTILGAVSFLNVVPDLALCILVFSAYVNGAMTGQISGFFAGLFQDFISAAPLGMNSLVRTLIGALAGFFKGSFFLDVFLFPVILCVIATIMKAVIIFILHLVMGGAVPAFSLTAPTFWIELGLNALCAPLLFLLLKKFRPMNPQRNN